MDEGNWQLCRWVIQEARRGGALALSEKKRALRLDSLKFIRDEAFLEFRRERDQKLRPKTGAPNGTSAEAAEDKRANSLAFVLEQLADPELSEEKKAAARSRWRAQNPGVSPPWETSSARAGAQADA